VSDAVLLASVGSVFERAIVDTGRLPEFLLFVSFLLSFGFIRTSAHMIRAEVSWWPGNVEVGGTHIHHLVWGILLMTITGYAAIAFDPGSPWEEIIAVLFGIGMGLTYDEFALWLNLKDVYWSDKGRRSIDAVMVAAAIGGILLIGFAAWIDVGRRVEDGVFAAVGFFGIPALILTIVNLLKEKFGMALGTLLIPIIGLVGAFRLARPDSPWARMYGDGKLERSRERYSSPRGLDRLFRRPRRDQLRGDDADRRGDGDGDHRAENSE
jgi:hypothetical protein